MPDQHATLARFPAATSVGAEPAAGDGGRAGVPPLARRTSSGQELGGYAAARPAPWLGPGLAVLERVKDALERLE